MAQELFTLTLEIDNLLKVKQRFDEAADRLEDLQPVWKIAHLAFLREMDQQFKTEGKYFMGAKWAPLSPAYARRKPRPPPPYGILYRTGLMWLSLTDERSPSHIKAMFPKHAYFGSNKSYAHYHQTGTDIMPQRKIIHMRDGYKRQVIKAAILYALKGEEALHRIQERIFPSEGG